MLWTVHVGSCEQNAVVAKEHSDAVGLVAVADEVAGLRCSDLDVPADVGEPIERWAPIRSASLAGSPIVEQVDIRDPDSRWPGDDGSVGVDRPGERLAVRTLADGSLDEQAGNA